MANDSLAVILSGGGARGAYEAGVLSYAFGDLPGSLGIKPKVDLICGTSVGAINGAYMASVADDLVASLQRLVRLWSDITLREVFDFGVLHATRLYRVVIGGSRRVGLLDARPMARLIQREVDWRRLARNLHDEHLRALVISTTHIATGRTVVHVDAAPNVSVPMRLPRGVSVRSDRIRAEHVLASAAIPLLFPPVLIGSDLYCDGGLRLNTPMAPAIHMGATKLLVVGMARPAAERAPEPPGTVTRVPGATFLLGKVLNAFLLDHVAADLEELDKLNRIVRAGIAAYGDDFVSKLNDSILKVKGQPIRYVSSLAIRPSEDIGKMAADHLRKNSVRFGRELGTVALRLLDFGEASDADLASYILFDGAFAKQLVALGRRDAAARREELATFLYGV